MNQWQVKPHCVDYKSFEDLLLILHLLDTFYSFLCINVNAQINRSMCYVFELAKIHIIQKSYIYFPNEYTYTYAYTYTYSYTYMHTSSKQFLFSVQVHCQLMDHTMASFYPRSLCVCSFISSPIRWLFSGSSSDFAVPHIFNC